MDSAFHQLCPRYSGTLTPLALPTATSAIRLWETFTFYCLSSIYFICKTIIGIFLYSVGPMYEPRSQCLRETPDDATRLVTVLHVTRSRSLVNLDRVWMTTLEKRRAC